MIGSFVPLTEHTCHNHTLVDVQATASFNDNPHAVLLAA